MLTYVTPSDGCLLYVNMCSRLSNEIRPVSRVGRSVSLWWVLSVAHSSIITRCFSVIYKARQGVSRLTGYLILRVPGVADSTPSPSLNFNVENDLNSGTIAWRHFCNSWRVYLTLTCPDHRAQRVEFLPVECWRIWMRNTDVTSCRTRLCV